MLKTHGNFGTDWLVAARQQFAKQALVPCNATRLTYSVQQPWPAGCLAQLVSAQLSAATACLSTVVSSYSLLLLDCHYIATAVAELSHYTLCIQRSGMTHELLLAHISPQSLFKVSWKALFWTFYSERLFWRASLTLGAACSCLPASCLGTESWKGCWL